MKKSSKITGEHAALAKFINKRITELAGRKSQKDIAATAGFANANVISMIKNGKTKLPLDRVPSLAKALECDPAKLFLLALEQHIDHSALVAVQKIFKTVLTENEFEWIKELRNASDNTDPPLTPMRRKILRAIFGKLGWRPKKVD